MEKSLIKIKPCKRVDTLDSNKNSNGWLLELLSDKDNFTKNMKGQVYLTTLNPGVEKGYHIHAGAQYYITCIKGNIKSIIYLDRTSKQEIDSGEDNFLTYELPVGSAHLMSNKEGVDPAYILCYRYPSWSPDFKEQLDISPDRIETNQAWQEIEEFVKNINEK